MEKIDDKEEKEELLLIFKVLYENGKITETEYRDIVEDVYNTYT